MSPPWELDPVASCSDERSESIMVTTRAHHPAAFFCFLVFSCRLQEALSLLICDFVVSTLLLLLCKCLRV
uniref:Uncharacterized protein n=1 Tax=Arundo donax TaxID=35708 RepID=A0A0A9BF26_ARUDO